MSVTGRGRNYECIDRYINEEIILNDHLLAIKNGNNFVIVSKIQKNSLTVCERNYQIYKVILKLGYLFGKDGNMFCDRWQLLCY